jgi:FkbM family methyltransferase
MLIDPNLVKKIIDDYKINVTGILHVGAHECEELRFYNDILHVSPNNVIWIDGMEIKVMQCLNNGIPNVYHAVITDKDDDTVEFHISNHSQSSSILDFKTHSHHRPDIYYINTIQQKTITIDSFFKKNELSPEKYVFWNFDIQGAEMMALKGASDAIKYAKIMYMEVNEDELYKDCARIGEIDSFLGSNGFKRVHTYMTPHGWGDAIYVKI